MTGDCHVRFCERLRGETPLCLLGVFAACPAALRGAILFFSPARAKKRALQVIYNPNYSVFD
jgi:hypothetical protein